MRTLRRWLSTLARGLLRRSRSVAHLPALPRHPERGLRVEAGDTLAITEMTIAIQDATEIEGGTPRTFRMRVPPWAADFRAGATFALTRRLEEGHYRVDGHRVDIAENGWTLEVALNTPPRDLLTDGYTIAQRTLDLLAAEGFLVSDLHDPLREHSLWFRQASRTVLRAVSTTRIAVVMKTAAEVRDPTGAVRPQPSRPPTRWHASHAYFRRSQATDSLHEAYRNLFLALESLLSEVYPWDFEAGEVAWLKAALKHVAEGYSLDLSPYVGGAGGNPYKRFVKQQYRARRCALFHAKLSEGPMLPGDIATRAELLDATRRLGQLYVRLAQLITGAGFAGGAMTYAAFEEMMKSQANATLYISQSADFDINQSMQSSGQLVLNANGQPGMHEIRGAWRAPDLPEHVARAGALIVQNGELVDGLYAPLNLDTAGADSLEVVFQNEMANARNLREWYL